MAQNDRANGSYESEYTIHEETGISVKTLNRTIRKLKESGMVGITKGKVTMDEAQQKLAREYVQEGKEQM